MDKITRTTLNKLLSKKIFISTRPHDKSKDLRDLFTAVGSNVLELPMIQTKVLPLQEKDKAIIKKINTFDLIVFTSENGISYFMNALKKETGSHEFADKTQIAVIGNKTARIMEGYGCKPDFISSNPNAAFFAEALAKQFKGKKKKVLWPTGNISPDIMTDKLGAVADITRIDVYQTVVPKKIDQEIMDLITSNSYALIFFFSPSAVNNFVSLTKDLIKVKSLKCAVIGTTTLEACKKLHITPLFTASKPGSKDFFESTVNYYKTLNA